MIIYKALRLPVGKVNGIYKEIIPESLASTVIQELKVDNINEVILANAFGTGGNMARYATLEAGLPEDTMATTIDSQCSGGLRAVELAHSILKSNDAKLVIAGGMESRSLAPQKAYAIDDPRFDSHQPFYTTAIFSPDQEKGFTLLNAAKNVALKYGVTKEEMLWWTEQSHKKAASAEVRQALKPYVINHSQSDQSVRPNTDFRKLSTAALIDRTTAAHYNDGAAGVLLGQEGLPFQALAKIVASFSAGCNPAFAPEGVIVATEGVLKKSGLKISDIDVFEVSESFAVIPEIFKRHFKVNASDINPLGGTLAYGHPFGASGTINLIHLIAALKWKNLRRGLVTLPAAGGLASAMIIENVF